MKHRQRGPVRYVDLEPRPLGDEEPGQAERISSILFVVFMTVVIVLTTVAVFFPHMKPRDTVGDVQNVSASGARAPR